MKKRIIAMLLVAVMTMGLFACGQSEEAAEEPAETTETTVEKPETVTEEDWAAMQKEPVFGQEINYLFNGGACVSAKYQAEQLGYYEEYGINAKYLAGGSVVDTVGTGQCMWGTDHIATMLVPVTNGVNMTFVAGAHLGCKSIYVPADSDIQSVEDLVGKTIAIHDGIGNSDQNICYRLIDEYGVDPTKDVKFTNIEDSAAAVQAMMETGEVADQTEFWNNLHFGLSDVFTERALREIAEDYIRLGIITNPELTADDVMEMAWTNVCPDEEIEGLTVGDPVEVEGATMPIQQYEQ